jgi:hypothetical protein
MGTSGDFVASARRWCFFGLRAAADTRGQYSTPRYTGASIVRCAMRGQQKGAQERRREGGTRDEETGNSVKEVARTAGGTCKAAGARVIGG